MTRRRSASIREEEKAAEEAKLAPQTPLSPEPGSSLMSDGEDEASEKRKKMVSMVCIPGFPLKTLTSIATNTNVEKSNCH